MSLDQPRVTPAKALPLRPHPASSLPEEYCIEADVEYGSGLLRVHYRLIAPPNSFCISSNTDSPKRRDGLWQHTCFELFIADADSTSYTELNFSPSGDWAAYRFTGYRTISDATPDCPPPGITTEFTNDGLSLSATIAPEILPSSANWQIGLSCVLEHADGKLSYWAFPHPAPRPDFHQRAGFTLSFAH